MSGDLLALGAVAALAVAATRRGSKATWNSDWWKSPSKSVRVLGKPASVFKVGKRLVLVFDSDLQRTSGFDPSLRWTFVVRDGRIEELRTTRRMRSRYHLTRSWRVREDPWDKLVQDIRRDLQHQLKAGSRNWYDEDEEPIELVTIPVGTTLYHGTQAPEDFVIPDGPAWFSDSETVAEDFVGWNEWPEEGRHRPRILTYRVIEPIELVRISDTPSLMALLESIGSDVASGVEMAEDVCRHYAGWHIPHNYFAGSDTLICYPDDYLELVEERDL